MVYLQINQRERASFFYIFFGKLDFNQLDDDNDDNLFCVC